MSWRISFSRPLILGYLFAAVLCLSGFSQEPPKPGAPQPSQGAKEAPAPRSLADPVPGLAAPVDPKTYIIGPEDVVRVRVWREAELSDQHVVRPDGRITVPLIREIMAAGRTPEQLEKAITAELEKFLTKPEVVVSIADVRSQRYWMVGAVMRSGPYALVSPTTVLQALSIAGLADWAKKDKIVIVRGDQRIKFNYSDVLKGKNINQNILLQNGDHVIVPI